MDEFWKGWVEAVEAMETRLEMMRKTVDSHSRPMDIVLDLHNELRELKSTGAPI